ncbi:MAG: hypothetical protein J0L92_02810 [Deltaproteobacteria bacterium]|nr:hypothetical protein [Deltaproteobacteria bacterium]
MSVHRPEDPKGFEGFEGFEDIFADLFAKGAPRRGADLKVELRLTLFEAMHGCTKVVDVQRSDGVGHVKVAIPPGIRTGQSLRLEGQGDRRRADAATGGHTELPPGHLFLVIELDLPKGLSIEGNDLVARVRLDPAKAARGGTIVVPWIDGTARVVVPPRTQHEARLVKRGWGLSPLNTPFSPPPEEDTPYRSADAGERGDLVVIVSHGDDPDTMLEAELAAMPARRTRFGENEVRAASIGLAIVAAVIGYMLLSR